MREEETKNVIERIEFRNRRNQKIALILALLLILFFASQAYITSQSQIKLQEAISLNHHITDQNNQLLHTIKQSSDRQDLELRCIAYLFTIKSTADITSIDLQNCSVQAGAESATQSITGPQAGNGQGAAASQNSPVASQDSTQAAVHSPSPSPGPGPQAPSFLGNLLKSLGL